MPKQLQIGILIMHVTMLLMGCMKNMPITICAIKIKRQQQEAQAAMATLPESDFRHAQPSGHPLAFIIYSDVDDNLVPPAGSAAAKDLGMSGVARLQPRQKCPFDVRVCIG